MSEQQTVGQALEEVSAKLQVLVPDCEVQIFQKEGCEPSALHIKKLPAHLILVTEHWGYGGGMPKNCIVHRTSRSRAHRYRRSKSTGKFNTDAIARLLAERVDIVARHEHSRREYEAELVQRRDELSRILSFGWKMDDKYACATRILELPHGRLIKLRVQYWDGNGAKTKFMLDVSGDVAVDGDNPNELVRKLAEVLGASISDNEHPA